MQIASSPPPLWRNFLVAIANLFALLFYAVGLLSPLTPSEGTPDLVSISIFVGIPIAILGWCLRVCSSLPATLLFGLQLAAVVGSFAYLFLLQSGALSG